ncbi:M23 family metallopeptidase [Streptomyces sp. NPDC050617]|uniref:M23 family metallopeptidase n=1 Tax=Streptomyces sp. NPDC050617 TaxID=3154628 RepID=UPI00342ADBD0
MSKHAPFRSPKKSTEPTGSNKSVLRTRAAILAAGLGASAALGSGVALAADAGHGSLLELGSVSTIDHAIKAQASGQKKAAEKEKKAAEQHKKDAAKKASSWVKPVDSYQIGQPFGIAGSHWSHNHSGQDLVVDTGTPVKSVHGGTVVKAGPNGGGDGPAYGNAIVVKHDDNTYSQYAHLSKIGVHVGQSVKTGQEIGRSGSTGNSTGPHLHFEIRTTPNYGTAVEPLGFMKAHGDKL